MAAQTQTSPLPNCLYEADRGPLRRQPCKISVAAPPNESLNREPNSPWHYLRPERAPGSLLARSSLLFDNPRSAQIVE